MTLEEKIQAIGEALLVLLEEREWSNNEYEDSPHQCPDCGGTYKSGHQRFCTLNRAITKLKQLCEN